MYIKDAASLNYALNDAQIEPMLPRGYMGLSNIGEKCYRKLQFDHYWAYKIRRNKRIDRLLKTGHLLEPMVIAEILDLGFTVVECGIKIVGAAGHWQGHEDVILNDGERNILAEVKTHKNSEFQKVIKKGFKESHPKHWLQMNAYMGYKKLSVGLYIAINKDTSTMYVEYVEFDQGLFEEMKVKQYDIIAVDYLHKRIGNNSPAWFECKLCDACDVCFGKVPVEKNYRTDARTDVNEDGIWSMDGVTIPLIVQNEIPNDFTYNPIFDSI
jgi:hypothetical protein